MIIVADTLVISITNYFYYIIYFKSLIYTINGGKGNLSIGWIVVLFRRIEVDIVVFVRFLTFFVKIV